MIQVNILKAKTGFFFFFWLVETGREESVIITRYGKPVVKLTPYTDISINRRIGIAKGKLKAPIDLDKHNDEIYALFGGIPD